MDDTVGEILGRYLKCSAHDSSQNCTIESSVADQAIRADTMDLADKMPNLEAASQKCEWWPMAMCDAYEVLSDMPSIVCSKILSFMHWQDKQNAVQAFPKWKEHLSSPQAWSWFSSSMKPGSSNHGNCDGVRHETPMQFHRITCYCIRRYGFYFQNCDLTLHDLDPIGTSLELIETVAIYCRNAKTVRIHHELSQVAGIPEVLDKYFSLLRLLRANCQHLRRVILYGVQRLSAREDRGLSKFFSRFDKSRASVTVDELEFSTGCKVIGHPLNGLAGFDNLLRLRCPIQALSTEILVSLASKKLTQAFVVYDAASSGENFDEAAAINWHSVYRVRPTLEVHYTVRDCMHPVVSNPLVHSLILDSLVDGVDRETFDAVVCAYGRNLRTFAYLAADRTCFVYRRRADLPGLFASLARGCPHLHTFAAEVEMPAAALLLTVTNKRLKNVWVDGTAITFTSEVFRKRSPSFDGNPEDLEYVDWWEMNIANVDLLRHTMTKFLGFQWSPLQPGEISNKLAPLLDF